MLCSKFFGALKSNLESLRLPLFSRECAYVGITRRSLLVNVLTLVTLGIIGSSPCAAFAAPAKVLPSSLSAPELERALSQYKKIKSLEARFDQVKTLKGLQITLKSSGSFRLRKEGDTAEVEWQVNKPGYLKLRITPSSLEIFEEEGKPGKPLVENQEAQGRILRPLYAWLSVNSRLISEQYSVFAEGKSKFRLEPKEPGSPVKKIRIQLDNKKLVSSVALEEISGDQLKISFSANKVATSP